MRGRGTSSSTSTSSRERAFLKRSAPLEFEHSSLAAPVHWSFSTRRLGRSARRHRRWSATPVLGQNAASRRFTAGSARTDCRGDESGEPRADRLLVLRLAKGPGSASSPAPNRCSIERDAIHALHDATRHLKEKRGGLATPGPWQGAVQALCRRLYPAGPKQQDRLGSREGRLVASRSRSNV